MSTIGQGLTGSQKATVLSVVPPNGHGASGDKGRGSAKELSRPKTGLLAEAIKCRVLLECATGEISTSHLHMENCGSTTVYYSWEVWNVVSVSVLVSESVGLLVGLSVGRWVCQWVGGSVGRCVSGAVGLSVGVSVGRCQLVDHWLVC